MKELLLLGVRIGELPLAFPLESVREVIRSRPCVPREGLPAWVPGLVEFRGVEIPVIDLSARLGVHEKRSEAVAGPQRLVICARGRDIVAFAVPGPVEIVRTPDEPAPGKGSSSAPPPMVSRLCGPGPSRWGVLDLEGLLGEAGPPGEAAFRGLRSGP